MPRPRRGSASGPRLDGRADGVLVALRPKRTLAGTLQKSAALPSIVWRSRIEAPLSFARGPTLVFSRLYRSVWFPAVLVALALLAGVTVLAVGSWRSFERLDSARSHLQELERLQQVSLEVQSSLFEQPSTVGRLSPGQADLLRRLLEDLIALDTHQSATTPARLLEARALFAALQTDPAASARALAEVLRQTSQAETAAHAGLVESLRRRAVRDLGAAVTLALVLPLSVGAFLLAGRRRIVRPLMELHRLMDELGRGEYRPASTTAVDRLLLPVVENYNRMVERLGELERLNTARRADLEERVRRSTRALLEQQRAITRVERLAAVGEMAAGLAHELRNPLAGIELAVQRLRRETDDATQANKLDLILGELRRVTAQLNTVLTAARSAPEPAVKLDVGDTLEDLASLARVQIPEGVRLEVRSPHVQLDLPEIGLRQAVLNLVLNAAQAMAVADDGCGSLIVIEARLDEGSGSETLRLSVSDDGPGLPEALLEDGVRTFARFRNGGTGLGLATVRRFARDLGGELILENRDSGGACITIVLPARRSHG